jgi:predicted CXXCH cytochrome family protein
MGGRVRRNHRIHQGNAKLVPTPSNSSQSNFRASFSVVWDHVRGMSRGWLVIFGLILLGALFISIFPSGRSTKSGSFLSTAGSDTGYISSDKCAECHREIWETYRRTGMGRSFARISEAAIIEDYQRKNTHYHKASDRYYTMYREDGRFYQRRHQIGFDGKETNVVEREIDFVLGSGNHSRSYLHQDADGRLSELPVGWYAEKQGYWAMNPGYDRPDQEDFRRQINYQCMFCHNGYPRIEKGADAVGTAPVFRGSIPSGIDCERCHGPGRAHVEAMQTGKSSEGTIVNPARLSRDRQLELCMQCHLETTSFRLPSAINRYARGIFSYRPGEPLADYVLFFDQPPKSGHDEKFEIAHAAYRLRQSACFQKSSPSLLCTTCHNPHDIPRGEEAARHYTAVCLSCHAGVVGELVRSNRHTALQDCIGCHMPKRRTEDVVHVVMTDHYIQRRKPAGDLLAPLMEKIETDDNSYRGRVDLYYPAQLQDSAQQNLYLAVAQVRQNANLAEGTLRLQTAINKYHPAEAEFYFELAEAFRKRGNPEQAVPMFEQAIQRKPDFRPAVHALGTTLAQLGRLPQAKQTLLNALKTTPEDASVLNDLGLVYIATGDTAQAVVVLQRASHIDPDYSDAYNNLGGALLRLGDRPGAEAAYRTAIQVRPDFSEAHQNLASLLNDSNNFAEAQYHFRKAIQTNPKYGYAYYEYGLALAKRQQFREAKEQFEAASKADPNLAEVHNALGEIWSIEGDSHRAIQSFEKAVAIRPELARAQLNLGTARLLQGRIGDAKVHLERALALSPGLFEAHLNLGRALSAEHDVANAAAHYRKAALSSDPEVRRAASEGLKEIGQH